MMVSLEWSYAFWARLSYKIANLTTNSIGRCTQPSKTSKSTVDFVKLWTGINLQNYNKLSKGFIKDRLSFSQLVQHYRFIHLWVLGGHKNIKCEKCQYFWLWRGWRLGMGGENELSTSRLMLLPLAEDWALIFSHLHKSFLEPSRLFFHVSVWI